MLEYLGYYELRKLQHFMTSSMSPPSLYPFSELSDPEGYNDDSISDDIVTEIYLHFFGKVRSKKSVQYMKTLSSKVPPLFRINH